MMVHEDTISLLRECSAGIKMGTASIDEVLESAEGRKLKEILSSSKDEHNRLGEETEKLLGDKAYLESIYKEGAEKAAYLANKTLRKVYKKVGFVAR